MSDEKFYALFKNVFCFSSLIVIASLDILLRHVLFHREVYGFEVLYVVASMTKWPMALAVLIAERSYQLPTPPRLEQNLKRLPKNFFKAQRKIFVFIFKDFFVNYCKLSIYCDDG